MREGRLRLLRGCHVGETGQSVVAEVLVQWVKVREQQIVWGLVQVPVGDQLGWRWLIW